MTALWRLPLVAGIAAAVVAGLRHFIRLGADWPVWGVALALTLAVEAVILLTAYERRTLAPARARWILGLRLAALVLLAWMILEPSWIRTVIREKQREVVVVLDDSASMHLQDDGVEKERLAIGEEELLEMGLEKTLSKNLRVRTVHAARSVKAGDGKGDEGWNLATDLESALSTVLEQVPPDELGGVVLVSDGRHNRPSRVEDVARRLGILEAPVAVLAVGSEAPPRDAAILRVDAPEAIHLGDRMRVKAEVKFDGYRGRTARVSLMRAGEVLESQEIPIPQDQHREELSFAQIPDEGGVGDFRLEIEALDGERFSENNGWDFETSITDARVNVLIVERHPRWEFRYLRNLFYGRDKSIHLQWLLLEPDRIDGQRPPEIPASAGRSFGEAQATALPANEEEWRKFDVIILGDLDAAALDEETWNIISRCVNERAAMLVLISGPESMPHALEAASARDIVPVEVDWGRRTYYESRGKPFHIELAAAGAGHPVTSQATDGASDAVVWSSFPEMRWRHPVTALKPGAEVLLMASTGESRAVSGSDDLQDALGRLANRREAEASQALLVTRQTGRGKVALLLTDRTWRLREGSGDVYHHRFWGNLVKWGAGPILRAGRDRVRVGTDQLTYTPDDRVLLQARLNESDLSPVFDENLRAEVSLDGKVVATVPLQPVESSNGLHEAQAGPFAAEGRYEVRLLGERAQGLMEEPGEDYIAGFRVVGSRGPVELAETTLNLPLLQTIADLSGGKVFRPGEVSGLPGLFLTDSNRREEVRETSLWDQWPVLTLLLAFLTAEWILRRGAGLP